MNQIKSLLIVLLIMCVLVSCNLVPLQDALDTTTDVRPSQTTSQMVTTTLPTTTTPTTTTTKPSASSSTTTGITTTTPNDDNLFDPNQDVLEKPEDPYTNINKEEFYANYTPATSYWDAYYRTQHYLMSGSIEDQDQAPTIAENQPMEEPVSISDRLL